MLLIRVFFVFVFCFLVCFPLVVGVLCLSLFCCALFCVLSSFAINLKRMREFGCFAFNVLQMHCYCKCYVTLPHGVVGWSAVCDSGIC